MCHIVIYRVDRRTDTHLQPVVLSYTNEEDAISAWEQLVSTYSYEEFAFVKDF